MSKLGTLNLTGASSREYKFQLYLRGTPFRPLAGVYALTKRNASGTHSVLYIGQTNDLSERFANHHRRHAFDRHGADHVSVYLVPDKAQRCAIELDLIHRYDPVCNRQPLPAR